MKKATFLTTLLFLFVGQAIASIIYVDVNTPASSGNQDGTSWATAWDDYPSSTGILDGDQVWIANGVYNNDVVSLGYGYTVSIYGGFAGNETQLWQRDPESNLTTFDSGTVGVNMFGDGDFLIDGIIWNNKGSSQEYCDYAFLETDQDEDGDITFRNCKFFNFDYDYLPVFLACGTGNNVNVVVEDCEFFNVQAETLTSAEFGSITFRACSFENCVGLDDTYTFFRNAEVYSSRIENYDGSRLALGSTFFSCLFIGNQINNNEGDQYVGIRTSDVVNCTFVENDCAVSMVRSSDVFNCISDDNNVTSGKMINQGCTVIHSILEEEHLGGGFGNIYLDPQFVNPASGDYHISLCSPGIDMSFGPELDDVDLDDNYRTYDGGMDLGCYEVQEDALDVIYVDANASGANNGKTWGDAFNKLTDALAIACAYSEIWVANGTYFPDPTPLAPNRGMSFDIPAGVEVYGGFAGGEISTASRDWENNVTTLSGAIGLFGTSDNSYNVVNLLGGVDKGTRLDGFAIGLGNANGPTFDDQRGAGIKASLVDGTIAHCYVTLNSAVDGAALYISGNGGLEVEDCFFVNNTASDQGGVVFCQPIATLYPDAWFDRCEFTGNSAEFGGCFYTVNSDLTISNSLFHQNSSGSKGDAVMIDDNSDITCRNLTVVDHASSAFYIEGEMHIQNSIFWDNDQHFDGSGTSNVSYCTVQGGWAGVGVLSTDPDFIDPANDDYRLPGLSSAVDVGSVPGTIGTHDLDGNSRVQNNQTDHGCYEFETLCPVANDYCEDAIFFADPFASTLQGYLECSSTAYEVLPGCGSDERSVWYRFNMGTSSAQLVIYPSNSADVNFTLFTGDCGSLSEFICIDNNGAGSGEGYAIQTTDIPYGTQVYLRIGSDGDNAGEVNIEFTELSCVIGNITAGSFSSCNANDEYQQELIVNHSHAPGTGFLVVNDTYFPIESSPQSVVMDWQPANGFATDVFAFFSDGTCSWLEEDVYTSVCCVSNDDCDLAMEVPIDQFIMDDNMCATQGTDYQTPCTGTGGRSVWYSFTAPASGHVEVTSTLIQAVTHNFNLRQALFYGGCTVNEYVGCSNTGLPNETEVGDYSGLIPGGTYLLRIDGTNAQRAFFGLIITEVESSCPGDFNQDGTVNTADLLALLAEFGCTSGCSADMDGDDQVITTDLLAFLAVFGSDCP
jgi:hypothetical protein